jgi:hypothetical protein
MPIETGFSGYLVSLSGMWDNSGRGRKVETTTVVVDTSNSPVLPVNNDRIAALLINNDSSNDIYLALGEDAAANKGIWLKSGGGWFQIDRDMPWTGAVNGIANTAACNLLVTEIGLQMETGGGVIGDNGGNGVTPPKPGGC